MRTMDFTRALLALDDGNLISPFMESLEWGWCKKESQTTYARYNNDGKKIVDFTSLGWFLHNIPISLKDGEWMTRPASWLSEKMPQCGISDCQKLINIEEPKYLGYDLHGIKGTVVVCDACYKKVTDGSPISAGVSTERPVAAERGPKPPGPALKNKLYKAFGSLSGGWETKMFLHYDAEGGDGAESWFVVSTDERGQGHQGFFDRNGCGGLAHNKIGISGSLEAHAFMAALVALAEEIKKDHPDILRQPEEG